MPRAKVKAKSHQPVERLTHKARRDRRLQIAKAVARGTSRGEVAEKFQVTSATVRAAVAEFPSIAASGNVRK
jgi:DNA-binding NarL/FixJ family response regulator